jgi:acyl dehydratase
VIRPVFIGETIRVDIDVVDKRQTQKEDRGIVSFFHRVSNQDEEPVMEYAIKRMLRCKHG